MRSAPRTAAASLRHPQRAWWVGGLVAVALAVGVRLWNALTGPLGSGYDAWGHVAYVLYLDLYGALPHADQGWSYFHPPLHYVLAWPLAWAGSAELLLRGMTLLASAASLGTAWLAARVQRAAAPERPQLAWLAFAAVAFLPSQLVASGMPGNELTAAFCVSLAVAHFVLHDDSRGRDLVTGALLGLALLAKYSALIGVLAVGASLATTALLEAGPRGAPMRRAMARGVTQALALVLVAGPFYARNLQEQGTPIPTSGDDPLVRAAESGQPPGVRHAGDFLRIPLRLFADANPLAPHMLGSVWGSLYANSWFDTHRASDLDRVLLLQRGTPPSARALLVLGLLPTGLALAGAALALRDVARGRRRALYVPLLWLGAGMLASQALFAWRMPTWAAVKGTYLLPASLAYGVFLARGFEALARRASRWASAALALLCATALASAVVAAEGLVLPRRLDAPAAAAARFYFGEYDDARELYRTLLAHSHWPVPWLDNLAATELAAGNAAQARALYERAVTIEATRRGDAEPGDTLAYRRGQLIAATALAGDVETALAGLDVQLARRDLVELRANRGTLLAQQGRLDEAEADLRAALAGDAEMWPERETLAFVARRQGRADAAAEALRAARREACHAPRGIPRGIGTGESVEWGVGRRWLLWLAQDGALRAVLPSDERGACARLAAESA